MHRLTGPAARNKGMALFPRAIRGAMFALTRSDGENTSIARAFDGLSRTDIAVLHRPDELWEARPDRQLRVTHRDSRGLAGAPARGRTDAALQHRRHAARPRRSDDRRARPTEPPLQPLGDQREGYVPNVVYSCGAVENDGTIRSLYGIGDQRIRVVSLPLDALLAAMTPVQPAVAVTLARP